jgi:hypothetical protein
MNYSDTIEQELNRLGAAGGGTLSVAAPHGQLRSMLSSVDPLAVAFELFEFSSARLAQMDPAQLTSVADRLASKLTYLLEPLRVIEVDGDAGAVQMRSHPPHQQERLARYYEVLVQRSGSISLVRYERRPGQPRAAILAAVTREVFHRLADDFAQAVVSQ